jgi:hypothetical protein
MLNSYHFKVLKAGWGVSVEGPYTYLARKSDGAPFEYFLNPAVYSGVTSEVYHDGTGYKLMTASHLDDRYSVGQQNRPVFGGSNAYPLYLSTGPLVNTDTYELIKLPKSGKLVPWLLVRAYDYRLASFEFYTLTLQKSFSNLLADTDLPGYVEDDSEATHNNKLTALTNETTLRNYLFTKLVNALTGVFGTSVVVDPSTQEFYFQESDTPFIGEHVLSYGYGELSKGSYLDTLLNVNFGRAGRDYTFASIRTPYPLEKPLSGMFTVMQRPERLVELGLVVKNAIQSALSVFTDASDSVKQAFEALMARVASEKANDWFRGVSYKIDIGGGKYLEAQVFLALHGSPRDGLAIVNFGSGSYYAVPVILGDIFDYEENEFDRAYPDSKSYVTGPYGSIPIYDASGNIIGWASDAYNK